MEKSVLEMDPPQLRSELLALRSDYRTVVDERNHLRAKYEKATRAQGTLLTERNELRDENTKLREANMALRGRCDELRARLGEAGAPGAGYADIIKERDDLRGENKEQKREIIRLTGYCQRMRDSMAQITPHMVIDALYTGTDAPRGMKSGELVALLEEITRLRAERDDLRTILNNTLGRAARDPAPDAATLEDRIERIADELEALAGKLHNVGVVQ
jgi:regulator of replication initiation timing